MSESKKKDPITRLIDAFVTGVILVIAGCVALTLLVKFIGFILLGLFLVGAIYLAVRFYRERNSERREHAEYRRTHP